MDLRAGARISRVEQERRKMADEFSKADKWKLVRGTNLKSEDRHCLVTLFLFQGENGTAFCKQETLAAEIGVSTRSIRKSLHRLNAAGIIVSTWQRIRSVPMRTYAIDFAKLKSVQRADGRNHSSDPEPCDGRNHSSTGVGTTVPDHQEPQFLQEDPVNIQGTSTIEKSPISLARSGRKPKGKTDSKLTAFCVEWNNWHSAGIVRQKIRDTDSPGKTIIDAWNRSQRDSEQRERLKDLAAIRATIAASQQLLKPASWFDAAGLIGGRNANRRWYLERLLSGGYADRPKPVSPDRTGGNGKREQSGGDDIWPDVIQWCVGAKTTDSSYPDRLRQLFGPAAAQAVLKLKVAAVKDAADHRGRTGNDFRLRELGQQFRGLLQQAQYEETADATA